MPSIAPLTSAAYGADLKRAQPIPKVVREAVTLMVWGRPDDPDCRNLSFVEACRETGMRPDIFRRYLDRSSVRSLLLAERKAFRAAVCSGNESALLNVRQTAVNSMAVVAAVRALEGLDSEAESRAPGQATPGVCIIVQQVAPAGQVIEGREAQATLSDPNHHTRPTNYILEPEPPPTVDPIFRMPSR
jgi:hypothetical protein